MGRKPREDFPGAWHHVMHRGARRAPVFLEDEHCLLFLSLLENTIEQYEVEIHGFSLMPNHYHLLLRSRHGNLSDAMQYLNGNYTRKVNTPRRWDGPVFKGRYTAKLVRDETRLPYILAYIHLNPLRSNLVTRIDSRCWTSLRRYLGKKAEPEWITTAYFTDLFKNGETLRQYTLSLHQGRRSWPETMDLEFGFFTEKTAEETAETHRQSAFESRFMRPEQVIDIVCEITGIHKSEIAQSAMGPRVNPARRFAVWALRKHTRLKNREIGRAIDMTYNQVSNVLSRFQSGEEPIRSWVAKLPHYVTSDGV
jgi:putative transposase